MKPLCSALAVLCLAVAAACATSAPDSAQTSIPFIAFGDSGNHPGYLSRKDRNNPAGAQASGLAPVSDAMTEWCEHETCAFALMLGDNIYPDGATGEGDAQRFYDILVEPFARLGLGTNGFRIYAALGNHDWKTSRAGARAQVAFMETTPPFYMDGWSYRVRPPGGRGRIEIFVLDTQLLLGAVEIPKVRVGEDGFAVEDEDETTGHPDWARPQTEVERGMAAWLEAALRDSRADWKVVIGHHPLWSAVGGKHAESAALRDMILPALCRYADAYFAGHEHTLEVHTYDCDDAGTERPPLLQVVSGAAGKQRTINPAYRDRQLGAVPRLATLYAEGTVWGFAHASVDGDTLTLRMIKVDADGRYRVDRAEHFRRRS